MIGLYVMLMVRTRTKRQACGKMLNPEPDLIIERGQLKLKSHRIGWQRDEVGFEFSFDFIAIISKMRKKKYLFVCTYKHNFIIQKCLSPQKCATSISNIIFKSQTANFLMHIWQQNCALWGMWLYFNVMLYGLKKLTKGTLGSAACWFAHTRHAPSHFPLSPSTTLCFTIISRWTFYQASVYAVLQARY